TSGTSNWGGQRNGITKVAEGLERNVNAYGKRWRTKRGPQRNLSDRRDPCWKSGVRMVEILKKQSDLNGDAEEGGGDIGAAGGIRVLRLGELRELRAKLFEAAGFFGCFAGVHGGTVELFEYFHEVGGAAIGRREIPRLLGRGNLLWRHAGLAEAFDDVRV